MIFRNFLETKNLTLTWASFMFLEYFPPLGGLLKICSCKIVCLKSFVFRKQFEKLAILLRFLNA